RKKLRLFDHAAGDATATAAERLGRVAVIVAAFMDHDAAALEFGELEARRDHFLGGGAVVIHHQYRQIATVAHAVRTVMLAFASRVVMTARGTGSHLLAVLGG